MRPVTRRNFLKNIAAVCSAAVAIPFGAIKARAANTHKVEIRKFKFKPEKLSVKPGDTIVWTNFDLAPHTATANDESWDTGTLKKGESHSMLVSEEMHLDYFCRFHPHMKAALQLD